MGTLRHVIGHRTVVGALLAATLPALLSLVVVGPGTPAALDRADTAALQGQPEVALERYRRLEQMGWTHDLRATAAYRAGIVATTDLEDPDAAAGILRHFIRAYPDDSRRPEALARLAGVLEQGDPSRAARTYERAVEAAPAHPDAGELLLRAAALRTQDGRRTQAWQTYERVVADYPDQGDAALLAMARMRLEVGDAAGAHTLYAGVLETSPTQDAEQIARLGLAIAAEDLGQYDAVLAELDGLELADGLVDRRRERVEARAPEAP